MADPGRFLGAKEASLGPEERYYGGRMIFKRHNVCMARNPRAWCLSAKKAGEACRDCLRSVSEKAFSQAVLADLGDFCEF